ncbi:hypothetical protein [Conexibacter woesei]|uniref:Ig-like domain-containing protein n=1 Tax=Conexibacter woesei (strain DSM 14684 / CCUG 47730 / CIP 108061 / JCM 11494 / NBRC 100937 / ID131577) TaxID=469383 RepID=D3FFK4_CONWI|nr:hypothetical protein [Conexibacter woesei]ADB53797.1 hypothetical protein Cwoe_5392 [Conexibacter woesei DSM 14684]
MRRSSLCVVVLAAAVLLAPSAASAATWSIQSTPEPATAVASVFGGVSCAGARECVAVGRWDDASQVTALAEGWDGSSWRLQTPATPAGAVASDLAGVHCRAAGECTAVGNYEDGGVPKTLVERWNGRAWAVQSSPNPGGSQGSYLSSVSCTSATTCTAVGTYIDALGQQQSLAMDWASGSWRIRATPLPAGAVGSFLSSVSCTSSTACTAVGTSIDGIGTRTTLALRLSSGTWSVQSTPNPAGAAASFLSGVSCPAAGACTAVGVSTDSRGVASTVAMTLASGTWSLQRSLTPGGTAGAALTGVSCSSTTVCTAVGYSYDGAFTYSPLAEDRSGTTWTVVSTPVPAGSLGSQLAGVSCSAAAVCTAAGYSLDVNSLQRVLAERYQ